MQRLYFAASYFRWRERAELSDGCLPRNAEWQRPTRRKNARRRQAPAVHAAARTKIPRQQNSVHSRRRHGSADSPYPATRTGNAAIDHTQRCRTRRAADLRPMHRDGARKTRARSGQMGDATSAFVFMEAEDLGDPTWSYAVYDRGVHHEHRPPPALFRSGVRARDAL